ncbi:alginate lyase family protein [Bacillus sp. DX1.1]|uniref:alginate lyase family protein n=1 Tax=unclassified Bacillus (in: firmicutes) TaxID=185979 RepID=UPI0025703386|nr:MULTISPECIES: alginate lyase family protein [unclassified Bacillus (in: firmicutes)]MDM5157368.1 alginate lyase family protein [Bacillus sp. DX1.1]WJE81593.1 alginate lyase family protein [Bacillus sp. DX3.1]
MKTINWYYHRLRAMSFKEIGYRVQQKINKKQYKYKYSKDISILEIENNLDFSNMRSLNSRLGEFLNFNSLEGVNYSSDIKVFNQKYNIESPIHWNKGMSGNWPKDKSSFEIPFRDQDQIGDIRFTWETNRHLFFVNLALQYKTGNNPEALNILKEHFYAWVRENPFLKGVNWASSMEIAIRAYQWMITYCILSEIEDEKFLKDLLKGITNSTQYVFKNLSLHSSANNHLILEVAIGSMIGYFLKPIYKQSWFEIGQKILKEQIPLQVYEDGVNKEQAVHYHAFVLDSILQYNLFLRAISKPPLYEKHIYEMVKFLGYLQQGGSVTEIGDSDDAKIIDVNGEDKNYYLYILQLASIYYGEQFIEFSSLYPEVALFNTGNFDNLKQHEYDSFYEFKHGGYEFLNHNNHYLIFDVGSLGFGAIAAHGHADALSLVYHFNKKPILVDPGTYIYNIESNWRDYFRKTSSHNTLSDNNNDQSVMNGPFLWSKKTHAKLIDSGETEEIIYMSGEHDGYSPNTHKRAITYMKEQGIVIIADKYQGIGEVNFTFELDVNIDKINDTTITLENKNLYMSFSQPYKIVDKWISKGFLRKEKGLGLQIIHDFSIQSTAFTIISSEPIILKNNEFIHKGKRYIYENYKNVRSVKN